MGFAALNPSYELRVTFRARGFVSPTRSTASPLLICCIISERALECTPKMRHENKEISSQG